MKKMSMKIDEIARLTGKGKATIQRWVKKTISVFSGEENLLTQNGSSLNHFESRSIMPNKAGGIATSLQEKIIEASRSRKPARFSLEEVLAIISTGGNNTTLAKLLRENAERKQAVDSLSLLADNQRDAILKILMRHEKQLAELETMSHGEPHYPYRISIPRNQKQLPPQEENRPVIPAMNDRQKLNKLVRQYGSLLPGNGYANAWIILCDMIDYSLNRNIGQLIKNASEREGKEVSVCALDIIEREGLLHQAMVIVYKLINQEQS